MLTAVVVFLRSIGLICSGHRAVALENLALRQQLAALKRTAKRPQLRTHDRLFWVLLARAWRDWRQSLVFVQPDTVVRWHREWFRRRWATRSRPSRPGRRPTTDDALLDAHREDEHGESDLGSPSDPRRIPQARHRPVRTDGLHGSCRGATPGHPKRGERSRPIT